jgi:CRISPR/Cas system CSM-associated protein Csm3 (group 7 of RAMP superfamily)
MEIVPAGTHFPLRFELVLSRVDDEQSLLALLIAALEAFDHSELSLGCRRSRGLGLVKAARWQVHRYDLTTQDGWLEWLASDPALIGMAEQGRPTIREAFSDTQFVPKHLMVDHRQRTCFEVDVDLKSTLLIRSGGTHADDPDAIQLTSAGKTLLSGTSVTGALRARAERIAGLLRPQQADDLVQSMFGPNSKCRKPAASHLRVSEQFLTNGLDIKAERIRTSRIKIDRFTQGVASGALFEEEVQYGGRFTIRLELRGESQQERGLLLLVLKDLMDGQLPLGGGAAIGRGLVRGTSLRICCLPGGRQYTLSNVNCPADAVSWCDEMIRSLSGNGVEG